MALGGGAPELLGGVQGEGAPSETIPIILPTNLLALGLSLLIETWDLRVDMWALKSQMKI